MCATCGCGDDSPARVTVLDEHHHGHEHPHDHGHGDDAAAGRIVAIERDILAKNDQLAQRNRSWLNGRRITALNLMSSPGAGKTTLLERTIRELSGDVPVSVIEGDQETRLDAERIQATGARAVQINTGAGCHLDAEMLAGGLTALDPPPASVVFIENVGNLVCPAMFDLGETAKVVVISVTEGDDKPLKYPHMFAAADLVLLNKTDLLPYVDFDVEHCRANARRANPAVDVLTVSARTGEGLEDWYDWLGAASSLDTRP